METSKIGRNHSKEFRRELGKSCPKCRYMGRISPKHRFSLQKQVEAPCNYES